MAIDIEARAREEFWRNRVLAQSKTGKAIHVTRLMQAMPVAIVDGFVFVSNVVTAADSWSRCHVRVCRRVDDLHGLIRVTCKSCLKYMDDDLDRVRRSICPVCGRYDPQLLVGTHGHQRLETDV